MDLFEAIKGRRSHRAFRRQTVEPEKIEQILEAAQWAPSPANSQPCEFIVITSEAARHSLHDLSEQAKRRGTIELRGFSYVRPLPQTVEAPEPSPEDELKGYSVAFLKDVPVIIAVIGNPHARIQQRQLEQDAHKYACAAAIENMLLAAHALGLGGLWFTLFDQNLMKQFLHVEPSKHVMALICIGYPALQQPPPPGRVPLEKKIRKVE